MKPIPKFVFMLAMIAVTFVAVPQPLPPASIIIEARDPATNRLIPSLGGLSTGDQVLLTMKAFDRYGQEVKPCTPVIRPIQGFSGGQIQPLQQVGQAFLMTAGQGFGSAELEASCAQFPNFTHKEFVAVTNTLQPPGAAAAPGPQGAPQTGPQTVPKGDGARASGGAGNAGAGTALAIGAVAAGVGLAAVVAAAAASGSDDGDNCPTRTDCCSGGAVACSVVTACGCPSGTTDVGAGGAGLRQCTC